MFAAAIRRSGFANHKFNPSALKRLVRRALPLTVMSVALAACASLLDDARDMDPQGSAFLQALYQHNLELSASRYDQNNETASDFYASRAIEAAKGNMIAPLDAAGMDDATQADMESSRARLMAAFENGAREALPDLSGRAQVAYDCWVYEVGASASTNQIYQCRARFLTLMGRVEVDIAPRDEVSAPVDLPDEANFIVYFGFDEWYLSAEALEVISAAIDTARRGGHGQIISAGHTDTSGSEFYNDELSVQRAEVVKATLVELGALPEAVQVIGYGESRLAIETGDGVREPLNRRTVITLVP